MLLITIQCFKINIHSTHKITLVKSRSLNNFFTLTYWERVWLQYIESTDSKIENKQDSDQRAWSPSGLGFTSMLILPGRLSVIILHFGPCMKVLIWWARTCWNLTQLPQAGSCTLHDKRLFLHRRWNSFLFAQRHWPLAKPNTHLWDCIFPEGGACF